MTEKKDRPAAQVAGRTAREIFEDIGDVEHVVYQFRQYEDFPEGLGIDRDSMWLAMVDAFRDYLVSADVLDVPSLSANDLVYKVRFEQRIHVVAAMRCLSLLLTNDTPQSWTTEEIADLDARLTKFYAIIAGTESFVLKKRVAQQITTKKAALQLGAERRLRATAARHEAILSDHKRFMKAFESYERMHLPQLLTEFGVPRKKWARFKRENVAAALATKHQRTATQIRAIIKTTKAT